MKKLTNNQKKFLRARGHTLKSIVMVGQHGLSEAVLAELESTMTKHELLKIKIRAEDREDRQKMIDEIVNITQAHLIQVIGNVMAHERVRIFFDCWLVFSFFNFFQYIDYFFYQPIRVVFCFYCRIHDCIREFRQKLYKPKKAIQKYKGFKRY
jgi:RNA-binding protein